MLTDIIALKKDVLIEEVKKFKEQGYRFAALTCEQEGSKLEFTYHFDLDYKIKNLRVMSGISEKVESISDIFPAAFLIENEIQDLYGVEFNNLIIDYKGRLYLTPDGPKTPMLQKDKI